MAQAATFLTYIGYACAVCGVLGFILYLAADGFSTSGRIAAALVALATGLGSRRSQLRRRHGGQQELERTVCAHATRPASPGEERGPCGLPAAG